MTIQEIDLMNLKLIKTMRNCKLCKEEFSPGRKTMIYCYQCSGKGYYYSKRHYKGKNGLQKRKIGIV